MKELKNKFIRYQSMRHLYQNRLNDKLGTTETSEVENEWINIKPAVK
jgi:hypothetical protein